MDAAAATMEINSVIGLLKRLCLCDIKDNNIFLLIHDIIIDNNKNKKF